MTHIVEVILEERHNFSPKPEARKSEELDNMFIACFFQDKLEGSVEKQPVLDERYGLTKDQDNPVRLSYIDN